MDAGDVDDGPVGKGPASFDVRTRPVDRARCLAQVDLGRAKLAQQNLQFDVSLAQLAGDIVIHRPRLARHELVFVKALAISASLALMRQ